MDISTIVGIIGGFGCISYAIMAGVGLGPFLHAPSFLIVFGGALGATLINYPLPEVLKMAKIGMKAVMSPSFEPTASVSIMLSYAEKSRREGLLSLEDGIDDIDDEFIKLGMRLVIDGTEPDEVRDVLETEMEYIAERHNRAQQVFLAMAKYAPGFGMIGTLVGLISMLRDMDDPSSIGPSMAIALITTFYGAILANLVFMPIAGKLKTRTQDESLMRRMVVEAIVMIQAQANPRLIGQKLHAHLPPSLRDDPEKQGRRAQPEAAGEVIGESATSSA